MTREGLAAERLAHYRHHRNRVGEQVLRAALRLQATVDAIQTSNGILSGMGLEDYEIDVETVTQNAITVFHAEIASILARRAEMPISAKMDLVRRIVARMAPLRDGAQQARTPASPALARTGDIANEIMRQSAKMERGEGP